MQVSIVHFFRFLRRAYLQLGRLLLLFSLIYPSVTHAAGMPTNFIYTFSPFSNILPATIYHKALAAYHWALKYHPVKNKTILTIVDFSLPSNEKRLWVLDLKHQKVLLHLLVAQGKYSGEKYAKKFSNTIGSKKSSVGTFLTQSIYTGKHGVSERLIGLEKNINNHALERNIVVHGAPYVSKTFIQKNGRLGQSWGCFAINPKHIPALIHYIKGGSVFFVYSDTLKTSYTL